MLLAVPENLESMIPLKEGRTEPLEALKQGSLSEEEHIRVDLRKCPRCESTAAIRAKLVKRRPGKDGKVEEDVTDISESILVPPAFLTRLGSRDLQPHGVS